MVLHQKLLITRTIDEFGCWGFIGDKEVILDFYMVFQVPPLTKLLHRYNSSISICFGNDNGGQFRITGLWS